MKEKKAIGRPLVIGVARSKLIKARVSKKEREDVELAAAILGMTVSDFIRELVVPIAGSTIDSAEEKNLYYLGNSLTRQQGEFTSKLQKHLKEKEMEEKEE